MQTSYNVDPEVGVVGTIAESGTKTTRARVAAGPVRPGQYVVLNGKSCAHPTAQPTPQTRGGIALRDPYKQNNGVYGTGDLVDIAIDGAVWVASEDAVTEDGPAFVRHVATDPEELGALRSDADGTDATHVPGLYFRSAGTGPLKLEVNKSAAT